MLHVLDNLRWVSVARSSHPSCTFVSGRHKTVCNMVASSMIFNITTIFIIAFIFDVNEYLRPTPRLHHQIEFQVCSILISLFFFIAPYRPYYFSFLTLYWFFLLFFFFFFYFISCLITCNLLAISRRSVIYLKCSQMDRFSF